MCKPKLSRSSRRRYSGFSLLEIIVAIAIIGMISAAVSVAIYKQNQHAKLSLTSSNAETIRNGAKLWGTDHDGCPTLTQLVSDGALDRSKSLKNDAWQEPWRIQCREGEVSVASNGPDKTADTEDDIVVPGG
jgi:prepilin-type N-terminal cleavage/methylation domain-containing protein